MICRFHFKKTLSGSHEIFSPFFHILYDLQNLPFPYRNTWNRLTLLTYVELLEIDLFYHLTVYQHVTEFRDT